MKAAVSVVHAAGLSNIRTLCDLLSRGNGQFLLTVHNGHIVAYSKVPRPVQVQVTHSDDGDTFELIESVGDDT